ncbi:MAG: hypothetical protein DIU76_08825 [Bacillota bacterium]|nr:MAG: hypothetical protein DIU76_08825 [Bacillota bacterium]
MGRPSAAGGGPRPRANGRGRRGDRGDAGALWTSLIQFLLASLLVIAVAAWGSRALGRWLRPRPGPDGLEIRAVVPLGGRRLLCVVRWRGDDLLLGVTDRGVSLLDRRPAGGDEPA